MRVAYLVNQYPAVSHSFIRREIQALERQGVEIARFAVRPSRDGIVAKEDEDEAARTRYIIGAGAGAIIASVARAAARAPARSLAALAGALRLGWRSETGLLRHVVYYIEALALADWLRRERLGHVHAHFGTNSATVAMLAARIADVGFSMTVHGPEEFDKPGLIGLAAKIEAAAFVVAVSHYGASQLRRLVPPALWERIRIVRCGVEKDFFETPAREAARASNDVPVFVSVGRLCEQKGQLTLVEAAALLKREGRAFRIRLVGDGPMRADIEAAAEAQGVADRIEFAGWKTPAEVRAEIESARVFVLPSYAEGLPVSIMEAFSLARPAIATYVAGIPELVRAGENGWLAPAGDAEALASAMRAALDMSETALVAMGQAGKERARAFHDIDVEAGKLKAHFAAALGQRGEKAP
ncbi:glycosyltransferase [Amphiplicatus metriothermophilus]|nr:glycosyltransferase [Amphiplicatus metriothermophilus]